MTYIFTVKDLETNRLFTVDLQWVLNEINTDHSDAWLSYDESNWEEGWSEWVEGMTYEMIKVKRINDQAQKRAA